MRADRAVFDRFRLVPRKVRETTARDWSTTLFGANLPAPLLLAPMGVLSILHPDGELARPAPPPRSACPW
jgi:lactate 2-monooxygenase